MQARHTSTALGGTGMALHASGTTEVLQQAVFSSSWAQEWLSIHTYAGDSTFMQESQCGTDIKGIAGRWEVCLPPTMHLLRLCFIIGCVPCLN